MTVTPPQTLWAHREISLQYHKYENFLTFLRNAFGFKFTCNFLFLFFFGRDDELENSGDPETVSTWKLEKNNKGN